MKQPLSITLAALLFTIAGCRHSTNTPAPANVSYQYPSSGSSGNLVVVPVASSLVDLSKPDVSTKSNSMVISGVVRLRGLYNPDAVVRIVIVDRRGAAAQEIRAILHETDSPNLLTYRAHFAPVPEKGSSVAISYDDYHPLDNYAATNIGSGGGGYAGSSTGVKGAVINSGGQGTKSSGGGKHR